MLLTDLNPNWCSSGGEGISRVVDGVHVPVPERKRIGLMYDCPCGCGDRRYVPFANPIDGGPCVENSKGASWQRTGDDFETLTLSPSIRHVPLNDGDCSWHGWIRDGKVTNA